MDSPAGSRDDAAAVCCMCGDHGLPRELFRCKLCRLRLQHRYCSELYPRATAYRQCNWCLRDGSGGGSPMRPTAVSKRRMSTSSSEMDYSEEDKSRRSCGGCSPRSAFSAEPGKSVKKVKAGDEGAVLPVPEATTTTKGRKPQVATGKARFRVKVRRYKLLAEVISC